MKLNFEGVEITKEDIEKAQKLANKEKRDQQIKLATQDVAACNSAVNRGVQHLKTLRAELKKFEKAFKKLENEDLTPKDFADICMREPQLTCHIGIPDIRGSYDS